MKPKGENAMSCDTPAPRTATRCGPCSPSERNRYFRDKRLTVADLTLEQTYLIARRRLINRAMLGRGVAEGYRIKTLEVGVSVGPGLAFDAHGRELVACETTDLVAPDDLLWLGKSKCGWSAGAAPAAPDAGDAVDHRRMHYLLSAHYAEAEIDGVRLQDECGEGRCEANHLCETVVYSLKPIEYCPSGLPDCRCQPHHPDLDTTASWPTSPEDGDPHIAAIHDRGPHAQLVDWSLHHHRDLCESTPLTKVGCLHVALDDGVPLACVRVGFRCGEPYIVGPIEDHKPRRLAYSNDTLFDLIRGCDLTRIQDVGWKDWLPHDRRRVSFEDFGAMFQAPPEYPAPKGRRGRIDHPPVDTGFWVEFSGPVQVRSLTPDIFAMTLANRDGDEARWSMARVPIERIVVAEQTDGDPPGTTRAFRPQVAWRFWRGEIDPDSASAFETQTMVEIEIRTGFIVDAWGQEVTGGGRYVPSDGCTPGGRFLSSFVVRGEDDDPAGEPKALPPPADTKKPAVPPLAEEA